MLQRHLLPALLALSACQLSPTDEPTRSTFAFETTSEDAVDVAVVDEADAAVPGARVILRETADDVAAGLVWQGVTDASGRARGRLSRALTTKRLVLVVDKPGHRGPYTAPAGREAYGPFAPASIQALPVKVALGARVALRAEGSR